MTQTDSRFDWVDFYMVFAEKLSAYKDDRKGLLQKVLPAIESTGVPHHLNEQYRNGRFGALRDTCPFTLMSTFNKQLKPENRTKIANALGKVLGVSSNAPEDFTSIPVVWNMAARFFMDERTRGPGDIDALWQVFEAARALADSDTAVRRRAFIRAYDHAQEVAGVGRNLSMGLYWIRPHFFVARDSNNLFYISTHFSDIEEESPYLLTKSSALTGRDYLQFRDLVVGELGKAESPVSTIPELSDAAYWGDDEDQDDQDDQDDGDEDEIGATYTLDSIMDDGCFLPRETLDKVLERLETKQNLILQGPPGTGKTWLAKRLAYALIGRKDDTREFVRPIQFHANMSYEDFVRGYRPSSGDDGDAKLKLVDGPFMKLIEDARNDTDNEYVMVIEEINRGNPAQIFGEMLTLLEADKRKESEALSLAYPKYEGERVHIPENVYVIGTMNVADRSLALVDFALRRRFAFIDLEPTFGDAWQEWCQQNCESDEEFLRDIQQRMDKLNKDIADAPSLGKQFCIGHSVVTPASDTRMDAEWFRSVIDTEIRPLLAEYWFDAGGAIEEHVTRLEEGL